MFKNYLKITVRNLIKHKAFSVINILGLAIGMAAFLLLFQYVHFEQSYDNFHENADNIYRVRNDRIYSDVNDKSAGCPPAVGPTLKKEFPEVLESARVYNIRWANPVVTYIADEQSGKKSANREVSFNQDKMFYAEPSFLIMFSFPLIQGSSETALAELNTAIISQSSARIYFGDDNPMGKTIFVTNANSDRTVFKITGVFKDVPENSHIKFEFLLSFKTLISSNREVADDYWGHNAFNTFVLLEPTADPVLLESKFPKMLDKYEEPREDYIRKLILQPLRDIHLYSNLRYEPEINGDAKTVYFLMVIAVFIIIIAWVNYINLSTARSTIRAREVGVRKVLGSQRHQLIKQFIFESMLLNIIAFIFAVVAVKIAMPYFNQFTGKSLALLLWSPVWILLGSVIILGAFLAGLYPAFILSSHNPLSVLKGQFTRSAKGINLRKVLVVFQFALSIILITSTLIVYKQLEFMRSQDLGMNMEQTLVLKTPMLWNNFSDLGRRFKNEIRNYPSIKSVTLSSSIPGKGYSNAASGIRPLNSQLEDGTRCFFMDVDEEYFNQYQIPFLAGRNFTEAHRWNESVILNEQAVKVFGLGEPESAVNQKIVLGGFGGQIVETVGVIKNYHHESLKSSMQPIIFNPLGMLKYISLKIESRNINQTFTQIEDTWDEIFPEHPFEYFFLDESFNNQYKADLQFGKVFGLFAMLAICVSCLGLFGLISFTSEQRTKEIGVRKVLGASVSGIVRLLTIDFIRLVLFANAIAWPIAYFAMNRWLQNFAYQTNIGFATMGLAGTLTLIIALLTVIFQAIKAATANPVDAIKYE